MSYHIEITENELGVKSVKPQSGWEHEHIDSARSNLNSRCYANGCRVSHRSYHGDI